MKFKVLKDFSYDDTDYTKGAVFSSNVEESPEAKEVVDGWIEKGLVEEVTAKSPALVIKPEASPEDGDKFDDLVERTAAAIVAKQNEDKPSPKAPPHVEVDALPEIMKDEKWGFKSLGEFMLATRKMADPRINIVDERFKTIKQVLAGPFPVSGSEGAIAAGQGTFTGEAASAGNLLAPGFLREVQNHSYNEDGLYARCRVMNISTNQIDIPIDETRPWDGGQGVQALWTGEGGKYDQSRPIFGTFELKPKKLGVLVPITEEMLSDDSATALDSYVGRLAGEAISFAIDYAIMNGAGGAAVPEGILQSGATIATSNNIVDEGIVQTLAEMYSRQINPGNAVWVISHDVWPLLINAQIGNYPVWTPPREGVSGAPFGTIWGRPLLITKACQAYSTTNDTSGALNFLDLSQYMIAVRGGINSAMSIHLWFDYQTTAFRWSVRLDGKTWTSAAEPTVAANTADNQTASLGTIAHSTKSYFVTATNNAA